MKVKGDRVLIELEEKIEKISKGGIIIPETVGDDNKRVFVAKLVQVGDGVEEACMYDERDFDDYVVGNKYLVEQVQFEEDMIGQTMILESDRLIGAVE